MPLNDGGIYYNGIQCPIAIGPIEIDMTAWVASKAPSGTVETTLKIYDQPNEKGNCVMCTVTTTKIT